MNYSRIIGIIISWVIILLLLMGVIYVLFFLPPSFDERGRSNNFVIGSGLAMLLMLFLKEALKGKTILEIFQTKVWEGNDISNIQYPPQHRLKIIFMLISLILALGIFLWFSGFFRVFYELIFLNY